MDVAFELFKLAGHLADERDVWLGHARQREGTDGGLTWRAGSLAYDHAYCEVARLWARVDGAHDWTDLAGLLADVDRRATLEVVR